MWKTIAKFVSEPVYQKIGFMQFYKAKLENKDGVFQCSFGKKIFQDYSQQKEICFLECQKVRWGFVAKKVEFLDNEVEVASWEEIIPKEKTQQKKRLKNSLSNDDIFEILTKHLGFVPKQERWGIFFFCPFHSNPEIAKLTFDLKTKKFICSLVADCQQKEVADIFDLWAKYKNISHQEAEEEISQLGFSLPVLKNNEGQKAKSELKKVEKIDFAEEIKTIGINPQQQKVFELVLTGKNVCFLGEAGTGKSFLLKHLIKMLRVRYENELFITSYTGRTAINIQGQTLHSFAGIGGSQEADWQQMLAKINKKKQNITRWKRCKVLIIDEISMLDGDLFDSLEMIARQIKNKDEPFGGIQLIMCGDFYQLPPPSEKKYKWCFEANSWANCIANIVCLNQIYRQTDNRLINLLQEVRDGHLSSIGLELLESLKREPIWPNDDIKPTQLYSTNEEVNQVNSQELAKLSTYSVTYHARDKENRAKTLNILTKDCLAPDKLELKIGAQVMLTINQFERNLVNGSQGKVINFKNEEGKKYPVVKFSDNRIIVIKPFEYKLIEYKKNEEFILASRHQIPLILAWAVTIHKSQGQTIERLRIDCEKIWAEGQLYVALSRATNLEHLQVINFHPKKVKTCQRVKKYYEKL